MGSSTVDALFPRISCGLPLSVSFLVWNRGEIGGGEFWWAVLKLERKNRRSGLGKTKNSKDLVVILNFLRVFTVSLRCTVLLVFVLI